MHEVPLKEEIKQISKDIHIKYIKYIFKSHRNVSKDWIQKHFNKRLNNDEKI